MSTLEKESSEKQLVAPSAASDPSFVWQQQRINTDNYVVLDLQQTDAQLSACPMETFEQRLEWRDFLLDVVAQDTASKMFRPSELGIEIGTGSLLMMGSRQNSVAVLEKSSQFCCWPFCFQ